MSKAEKLLLRFKAANRQFKWAELTVLLAHLGFRSVEGEGSRVSFIKDEIAIKLHKPHPQKEVKAYAVRQVKALLEREGLL